MTMTFGVGEIHRGEGQHRAPVSKEVHDQIVRRELPLMTGDNIRCDMSAPVLEPDTKRDRFNWKLYYGKDASGAYVLDLEFPGDTVRDQAGKHWQLGGQGIKNLQKSHGNTCNPKLYAGAKGGRNPILIELHDTVTGDVGKIELIAD